jgi:hypothetical protein
MESIDTSASCGGRQGCHLRIDCRSVDCFRPLNEILGETPRNDEVLASMFFKLTHNQQSAGFEISKIIWILEVCVQASEMQSQESA